MNFNWIFSVILVSLLLSTTLQGKTLTPLSPCENSGDFFITEEKRIIQKTTCKQFNNTFDQPTINISKILIIIGTLTVSFLSGTAFAYMLLQLKVMLPNPAILSLSSVAGGIVGIVLSSFFNTIPPVSVHLPQMLGFLGAILPVLVVKRQIQDEHRERMRRIFQAAGFVPFREGFKEDFINHLLSIPHQEAAAPAA